MTTNILVPQVTVEQAFLHMYHMDCANAAIHCANVRFSPITFRLQEALSASEAGTLSSDVSFAWDVVKQANGQYPEDPGR